MMHALGILHEQYNATNLKSTDPTCFAKLELTTKVEFRGNAPWSVTDYDPLSIMNYCRYIYDKPATLSKLDIVTLKALEAQSRAKM